jgi:hypothetical protein
MFPGCYNPIDGRLRITFAAVPVRTNLLLWSEDLSNIVWGTVGTASVTGSNTVNLPANGDAVQQIVSETVDGKTMVFSAVLSGSGTVVLRLKDGNNTDIVNSTVTLTSTPTRYFVSASFTVGNPATSVYCMIYRDATTATTLTVTQAQLELGNVPTPYIRSGATQGTYPNPAGWNHGIAFGPDFVYASGGLSDVHVNGLSASFIGQLAVIQDYGTYFQNGIPFSATGKIAITPNVPVYYQNGLPFAGNELAVEILT